MISLTSLLGLIACKSDSIQIPISPSTEASIIGKWLRQRVNPVTGSEVKTELTFAEGGVFIGKEDGITVGNKKCFGSWEGKWHPDNDNDVVIVEGTDFYACTPSEVPPTRGAYYDAFKLRDSNTVFRTAHPDQEYVRQ